MSSEAPEYGNITVHFNGAGLVYMRFMQLDAQDSSRFEGRILNPETMQVVRYTEQDVTERVCRKEAVGIPRMGWARLNQMKKVCKTVAEAKAVWNKVGWGPFDPILK